MKKNNNPQKLSSNLNAKQKPIDYGTAFTSSEDNFYSDLVTDRVVLVGSADFEEGVFNLIDCLGCVAYEICLEEELIRLCEVENEKE